MNGATLWRRSRNMLALLAPMAIGVSLACALNATGSGTPIDLWCRAMSWVFGVTGVSCMAGAMFCHVSYLDALPGP